jgi:hypothetical protein
MYINIISFKALRIANTNVCIQELLCTFFFRYILITLINFVGIRNTIGLPWEIAFGVKASYLTFNGLFFSL